MPDASKIVFSRKNSKLVAALSAYPKAMRDKVIKHVSNDSRLTFSQKLDFVDVARDVWADQDRVERQAKELNAAYAKMEQAISSLKAEVKQPDSASRPYGSVQDLINALKVR